MLLSLSRVEGPKPFLIIMEQGKRESEEGRKEDRQRWREAGSQAGRGWIKKMDVVHRMKKKAYYFYWQLIYF